MTPAEKSLFAAVMGSLVTDANAFGPVPATAQVCVGHLQEGTGPIDVAKFEAMVIYDYGGGCFESRYFTANNVPVKGDPAQTELSSASACGVVDNEGLLEKLGLVNDARANGFPPYVTISTFDGPNGGAFGYFYDGNGSLFKFDLSRGECAGFTPKCNPCASDRNIKDNFQPVDEQAILDKVAQLPIETWNYTDREPGVKHIGPMAQDFMAAFGVGDSDKHIHMVDANGVNLAAIKALNRKLEEKDAQIDALSEKLDAVMKKLEELG
jgi:hypothetical protein